MNDNTEDEKISRVMCCRLDLDSYSSNSTGVAKVCA